MAPVLQLFAAARREEKTQLACFRFIPTDSEIIVSLTPKVFKPNFNHPESDTVYTVKPSLLPQISDEMDEKYFYVRRNQESEKDVFRKVTEGEGWWKDMAQDKELMNEEGNVIGLRKTFVFFRFGDKKGSRKSGCRTRWIMHEFTLSSYQDEQGNKGEEWVLCKIMEQPGHYTRSTAGKHVYRKLGLQAL